MPAQSDEGTQRKEAASMRRAVMLFTRVPEAGRAKTRLRTALSAAECIQFYSAMLVDTVRAVNETGVDLVVAYESVRTGALPSTRGVDAGLSSAPCADSPLLQRIAQARAQSGLATWFAEQQGASMAQRLEHALEQVFSSGFGQCVVLGGDAPEVEPRAIQEAFDALQQADVAFGPAFDGGYYLMGTADALPASFARITLSQESALKRSSEAFRADGRTVALVRACHDIDTVDDFREFVVRARADERVCALEAGIWAVSFFDSTQCSGCGWNQGSAGRAERCNDL